MIISVYCGDIIIYGFENNMPYHVHDRPFIPMPLLHKLVGGESDSRVPHNSYENVTYSSRKQSPDDFGVQPQEQQQESVRQDEWRRIFSTEHKNMNQEHAAFALSNRTSIETNTPSKHIQSTHTHTHTHTHTSSAR